MAGCRILSPRQSLLQQENQYEEMLDMKCWILVHELISEDIGTLSADQREYMGSE
jgi:hypothetical protein